MKHSIYSSKWHILQVNQELILIGLLFHQISSWCSCSKHIFSQLILLHLYQNIFHIFMKIFQNTFHTQQHYNYSKNLQEKGTILKDIHIIQSSMKQDCQYSGYRNKDYFFSMSRNQEQNNFHNTLKNLANCNEGDRYIIH